jgi:hypothetical protein
MRRLPLTDLLTGPPPALPPLLDRVSERWWRTPPRIRAAAVALAAIAVLVGGTLHLASSPWGSPERLYVAAVDLDVGDRVGTGALRGVDWPSSLVPADALRTVEEATGTLTTSVPAGTVVTRRHLGDGGIGGALPPDRAAVPIPAELVPELPAGTRVDLVGDDLDRRGVALAGDAVVLVDDGEHRWVSVDRGHAADVAAATLGGELRVVVLPP